MDDDLRETAYEILLASAGASGYFCLRVIIIDAIALFVGLDLLYFAHLINRGLIVPVKEKKKDKKSRIMKKLGRKSEHVAQTPHTSGLVGLLETMRVQMEVNIARFN